MKEKYISFQLFHSAEQAKEVELLLNEHGIKTTTRETPSTFDAALGITTKHEIELFILSSDKEKANEAVSQLVESQIVDADKDHYLFDFTDEELYEVILKKEEWSEFDVKLAEKILKEKGNYNPEQLYDSLVDAKREEYADKKESSPVYIFFGYLLSMFSGLIGGAIGAHLYYSKNKLPNGEKIDVFVEKDRKHGKRMLIIGSFATVIWVIFKWNLKLQ